MPKQVPDSIACWRTTFDQAGCARVVGSVVAAGKLRSDACDNRLGFTRASVAK